MEVVIRRWREKCDRSGLPVRREKSKVLMIRVSVYPIVSIGQAGLVQVEVDGVGRKVDMARRRRLPHRVRWRVVAA